jgi:hypothetical protein
MTIKPNKIKVGALVWWNQPTRGPARIHYGFISKVGNDEQSRNFLQITFFDHIDKKLWFSFAEKGVDWDMMDEPPAQEIP